MTIDPVGAVSGALRPIPPSASPSNAAGPSFATVLNEGLAAIDAKVAKADAMMSAFALGEPVPVHQVTIALEEARIAIEMAVQVRERLTETYRSFMNMQV